MFDKADDNKDGVIDEHEHEYIYKAGTVLAKLLNSCDCG